MKWEDYRELYIIQAQSTGISEFEIEENLIYAKNLYDKKLPIIYDGFHFSLLVGISHEYIYKITNDPKSGYRKFGIPKKNRNGKRIIHEPLPNLKIIQKWILHEVLECIPVSPFAKAYKKNSSIKDNVRFHRNQKKVLRLDIVDFFGSIRQKHILNLYLRLGYTTEVSVLLSKLCTLKWKLPQGAPTSAYLSNLIMLKFDEEISIYCKENKIRYTRYADDMTFSGDFNEHKIIKKVKKILSWYHMELNLEKTNLMRSHNRQLVTGITVNEKIQVRREVRHYLRKDIYYIKKFGLDNHLLYKKLSMDKKYYLKSLMGKVGYCLYINPSDKEFKEYYEFLSNLKV